jgi:hypothetical protein
MMECNGVAVIRHTQCDTEAPITIEHRAIILLSNAVVGVTHVNRHRKPGFNLRKRLRRNAAGNSSTSYAMPHAVHLLQLN